MVLSSGTRNKIVEYFTKTLHKKGKVIATDMSELAPAIYEADKFYIVPKMTDTVISYLSAAYISEESYVWKDKDLLYTLW